MTGPTEPVRVLVVEDDPETADELVELLELHALSARHAGNAEEARRTASSFRPHFALIDLQLGESSGADLAAEWHEGPIRVIILSGRALLTHERARFGASPPLILPKPLNISEALYLMRHGRP